MNCKILFIGENWHGSNATSCKRALRFLGCDVLDIDDLHFHPRWQSWSMRAIRKLLRPVIVWEFEKYIQKVSALFHPEIVFVFKGVMIRPGLLKYFQSTGSTLVNFYPDWDFGLFYRQFGNDFPGCMRLYDVLFTPKSYHLRRLIDIGAKRVEFLPYAYDPWCHYPVPLTDEEKNFYQTDVVFIGSWEKTRSRILEELVDQEFPYQLSIWGNGWHNLSQNSPLRKYVKFAPAYGETQAKIFTGSKIALAFLTPPDLHTARSYEIPAYRAFMLAQRSTEHTQLFFENREIACFDIDNVVELRAKIYYYVEHENERKEIAEAGFRKVTEGRNSYIDRMKRVLEVYEEIHSDKGINRIN